jgi:hypothetical protein
VSQSIRLHTITLGRQAGADHRCVECGQDSGHLDTDHGMCVRCMTALVRRQLELIERRVPQDDRYWLVVAQELLLEV